MNLDLFLQTTTELIGEGMLTNLDGNSFKVFMVLGTYVDSKGCCYPTQATLADTAGVGERSVKKYIDKLLTYRTPSGDSILLVSKKKSQANAFYYSHYTVYPTVDNIAEAVTAEAQEREAKALGYKAGDVISRFRRLYFEKYSYEYPMPKAAWAQFTKLITQKVVSVYADKDLVFSAIDILVMRYDEIFKKPGFEAPTLWNFVTWVFPKCIDIANAESTDTKDEDERIAKAQAAAKAEEEREDAAGGVDSVFDHKKTGGATVRTEDEEAQLQREIAEDEAQFKSFKRK